MNRAAVSLTLLAFLTSCGGGPTPGGAAKKAEPKAEKAAKVEAPAETPKVEAPAEPAPAGAAAMHPWAGFKPGSFAKMKSTMVMTIAGNKTETATEMTYTLREVTADKAVVDVETSMAGVPPTKTTMDMPLGGGQAMATPTVVPDAPKPVEGEEELTIAGTTLKCKTMELTTEANGIKTMTKTWTSESVPGWAVKTVSKAEGAAPMETTIEVTEFKAM